MYCIIYALKNTINDKVYVGQTWRSLIKRFSENYRHSPHINNAIKKYGRDNFYYEVLTFCSTQQLADYWEKFFISFYDSIENGYNLREGGSRGKLLEATKIKISEAQSGEKGFWYGKTMPPEVTMKISQALLGEKNPFYGKSHNEEALIKMRDNHKNKPKKFIQSDIDIIKYKANTLNISYTDLAKEFNVHRKTISHVVNDTGPYNKKRP